MTEQRKDGSAETSPTPRPLLGRDRELARIRASVPRFGGMSVKGSPGVGRTALLVEAVRALVEDGWTPHRVVSLGATPVDFVPTESDRALRQALSAAHSGRKTVVVIDDAQWLKASTIEILSRRVGSPNLFILLSVSSGRRHTPVLDALWKDGSIDRIDLLPLGRAECSRLVENWIAGDALAYGAAVVDGAALFALTERAAGNLVVLRESTRAALDRGVLHADAGIWRLSGRLPLSDRLIDVVRAHVEEIVEVADYATHRQIRDALDTIALAGSIVLVAVEAVVDPRLIEELETVGLIRVRTENQVSRVGFVTPITGDVIAAGITFLRRRRLSALIADALDSCPAADQYGPREQVTAVLLHLDAGETLDAARTVTAARLSWRYFPPDTTARLAVAAVEAGGGFDAELILATAEGQLGLINSAEARLDALLRGADNDVRRAAAVRACADNLVLRLADPSRALALSYDAELAITDPDLRTQVRAQRGLTMHAIGDTTGALALLEPLMDELSGETLIAACFAVSTGATMIGRLTAALSALARVDTQDDLGATLLDLSRCFTLACAGRFDEATTLAQSRYQQAVQHFSPLAQSWFAWVRGGLLLSQGYASDAVRWCTEAHTLSLELGQRSMEPIVACDLVRALALAGRTAEAERLADTAGLSDPDSPALFGARGTRLAALGWLAAAQSTSAEPSPALSAGARAAALHIDSAKAHAANEHNLTALLSYVDAARCGAAIEVWPSVERLGALVEGDLAAVEVRIVDFLAHDAEPAIVLDIAAQAEKIGLLLHAAEMYLFASAGLKHRGRGREAAAAARQAHVLADRCGHPQTPLMRRALGSVLSVREREIATMAAQSLSNKAIAEALVLSTRTVETHLRRVYAKLGVTTRAELTSLRGSLLG